MDIPYLVVGALSYNVYGIPRSTRDADLVIDLGDRDIEGIAGRLGADFTLDPQMSFETVTASARYVLEFVPTQYKIELFLLRDEPYHQARFARRRLVSVEARQVWAATVEDVIVMKLRWGLTGRRSKDLEDVRNVLKVQHAQGAELDWPYIHDWCEQHGTRELLDQLLASIESAD